GPPAGERGAGVPHRHGPRQAAPTHRGADPLPALPAPARAREDRSRGRRVRQARRRDRARPRADHRAGETDPLAMTRPGRPAALLLALALGGCAGLFGAFDIAPSGLRTSDDRLRRLLASGGAAAALEKVAPEGDA